MARRTNPWRLADDYISIAVLMPALTLAGYGVGYVLDRLFGTSFLTVSFLLAGILEGFVELVRQVQRDTANRGRD